MEPTRGQGEVFVAYVPAFDLSSCGDTADLARQNIREAVLSFLRSSERMGTLNEILEDAGYRLEDEHWTSPEFVSVDRLTVTLPA
jgi:hypothetical protein